MNKVTKYRVLRGMTKSELSTHSGLSRQFIYIIEKDVTRCSIKSLKKIADALQVDVRDLI